MRKNLQIGVIGVGNIGGRVLKRLSIKHKVIGYDIVQSKVQNIISKNISIAISIKEIAKKCNLIFLSLPGPKEVESIISKDVGIIDYLDRNSTIVDLSTNSPETIKLIEKKLNSIGINFIEMPVSGGIMAAESGTLSAFVGGDNNIVKKLEPILDLFSNTRSYYGEYGKASVAKLLNNRIGIQCSFLVIESLIIGAKNSIDPKQLLDSFEAGSGNNIQIPRLRDILFSSGFGDGFPSRLAVKDLQLILSLEQLSDACSGATSDALVSYISAVNSGFAEKDFAIVVKVIEEQMNQKLK